jgi:NADPH:quinone reductase-like Zn-dependent oxidoreductase
VITDGQPKAPSEDTMFALGVSPQDGLLTYGIVPRPRPGVDQVLVRVHAAGITFDDADGPSITDAVPRPQVVRSAEFAGTVAGFGGGDGEGRFVVGQEVFGLVNPTGFGAAAEYVVVPATALAARPRSVSFTESAALPLGAVTAWTAVARLGDLRGRPSVLVDEEATTFGLYAIQIASLLGARVVAVVPEDLHGLALRLGADATYDPSDLVPATELVIRRADDLAPSPAEPLLTAIAGLVDEGMLRAIVAETIPMEAAVATLSSVPSHRAPGRTVLVVH